MQTLLFVYRRNISSRFSWNSEASLSNFYKIIKKYKIFKYSSRLLRYTQIMTCMVSCTRKSRNKSSSTYGIIRIVSSRRDTCEPIKVQPNSLPHIRKRVLFLPGKSIIIRYKIMNDWSTHGHCHGNTTPLLMSRVFYANPGCGIHFLLSISVSKLLFPLELS